jgi:TolB-like protein/DNA-binding winged helix-turn-helix (wHTH) protein
MPSALIKFLDFGLDVTKYELRRGDRLVKIERMPMELLILLAERKGGLVTREEIIEKLWGKGVFHDTEQGINTAVRKIRLALRDDPDRPRFVQTVVGKGYRFVALVVAADTTGAPATANPAALTTPSRRWRLRGWLAWPAALLLVVAFASWLYSRRVPSLPPSRSVLVVVPFANLSGDPEQDYFSEGITEEVITELARLNPHQLGVIARTSSMQYKGTSKNTRQIGGELGANLILEGSVRRTGEQVHITVQLIQVQDQTHLWAGSYDRSLRDILALQREMAAVIAGEISLHLSPEQHRRLASASPINPEAYDHYLRGRYFWNLRQREALKKSIEHFEEAIALDPSYARAFSGLADAYLVLPAYTRFMPLNEVAETVERAKVAANKALQLDPNLAEAHASVAHLKQKFEWDLAGAEKAYIRAIELNPNYATAHHWYGWYLGLLGRSEQSIAQEQLALKLDPLSVMINATAGHAYVYAGQYDRALDQCRKALDLNPTFGPAHWCMGYAYLGKQMYEESIREMRLSFRSDPYDLATLYARAGRTAEAVKILSGLDNSYDKAVVYTELKRKDEALEWLQRSYADRSLDPLEFGWHARQFEALRKDPRYIAMCRKVGLPN